MATPTRAELAMEKILWAASALEQYSQDDAPSPERQEQLIATVEIAIDEFIIQSMHFDQVGDNAAGMPGCEER